MLRHVPKRLVVNNINCRAFSLALQACGCAGWLKERNLFLPHGSIVCLATICETSSWTLTQTANASTSSSSSSSSSAPAIDSPATTTTTKTSTTTTTTREMKPKTKLKNLRESSTTTNGDARMVNGERKFEDLVFDPKGLRPKIEIPADERERINCDFDEVMVELNTLQSNVASIRDSITYKHETVKDTLKYLERSGLSLAELEQKVSFIHVAGTKGKGSTCALTESLLRAYGLKTGFFSSPHIVSITERVRINGEPISRSEFTCAFWKVYNVLRSKAEHENDMPAYFKFLTILSMHVFVDQNVDVAVLEVGIGGEQDCTNVLKNTKTVGICNLGLEHTDLLGTTLQEIAWQKGGIIKPESSVFTLATQPECLEVLEQRTKENNAKLYLVPPFEDYFKGTEYECELKTFNEVIHLNGSLSLQLAKDWLRRHRNLNDSGPNDTQMTDELLKGLKQWHWPARCQLVVYQNMNVHLDGAHTVESICVCCDWFEKLTKGSKNPKILIFNRTGYSNTRPILDVLRYKFNFAHVAFTPNVCTSARVNRKDQIVVLEPKMDQMTRAEFHLSNWCNLCYESGKPSNAQLYPSLADVFAYLQKRWHPCEHKLDVLITGSIHLIGAAICALDELTLPNDDDDNDDDTNDNNFNNDNELTDNSCQKSSHTTKSSSTSTSSAAATVLKVPLSV